MNGDAPRARHVAIIMDGNGRWAKKRHLPRALGHQRGVEAVPQLFGQRRKRRQLIDGYVDGPVHPSMVTAGQNRISRPVMSW